MLIMKIWGDPESKFWDGIQTVKIDTFLPAYFCYMYSIPSQIRSRVLFLTTLVVFYFNTLFFWA